MANSQISLYGKRALTVLNSKGWNAYVTSPGAPIGPDDIIRRGPASSLEIDHKYVVLPAADDPCHPSHVWGALDRLASKLDRQMPTIEINKESFPWTGFRTQRDRVKVITDMGHYVSYKNFIESLKTIIQL